MKPALVRSTLDESPSMSARRRIKMDLENTWADFMIAISEGRDADAAGHARAIRGELKDDPQRVPRFMLDDPSGRVPRSATHILDWMAAWEGLA